MLCNIPHSSSTAKVSNETQVLKNFQLTQSVPLMLLLLLLEKSTISILLFLHFFSNGFRSLGGFLSFFFLGNKFDVKTGSASMGSGFSSVGPFSPTKWSEQIQVSFFMSEIREKIFLPQAFYHKCSTPMPSFLETKSRIQSTDQNELTELLMK